MIDRSFVSHDPDQCASIVIDPRTWPPTREGVTDFVAYMRKFVEPHVPLDPEAPVFSVTQRCGRLYDFDTIEDFPVFDLPCGCDDPDCVVIEWREIDRA